MKIIFLGTPDFAVPSLDILIKSGYEVVGVITAPDKPAGRGQKLNISAIKHYALDHNLKVFQPVKLSDPDFLNEVRSLNADLQIVVAFRMMPEVLWSMPKYGTFNLHGSLLPQYRGAAPINRAVMNGERKTGVTTFFLRHEIDTGNIVFRQEIPIGENESAGELHDKMMIVGADLVLKTVKALEEGNIISHVQSEFVEEGEMLKSAPKIFKDDCKLNCSRSVADLHNQVRGLSPFPGAFVDIEKEDGSVFPLKIYKSLPEPAGTVLTHELISDGKSSLKLSVADGFLHLLEVQIPGKKRMKADELLRGFKFQDDWTVL
ncbi:MAG TPA: methionyl-tRNA formyltransferase [Bacteroidia bacterium]|nr:methionyl-tRNA formyltransferase [Bacteroidia bacterium]HQF27854.1 methionyl-tRNA formyltransferase [Bacteroidia bacterium]HQK97105.1 methionyl-tRNA formyltransferase [Bacteroidia bacterium]